MADVLSKGTLFPEVLVTQLINTVKGHSSLIALSQQIPIAFNGNEIFTFSMDSDIDVVAENGKKSHGGISLEPKKVNPIKVEYGARVSDEFMYASDEARIEILRPFQEAFAKKLARGLDLMAMHGINPRTKAASTVIGDNHFDKAVTQTAKFDAADPDAIIQTAVNMVQAGERSVTGLALSPAFASALAAYKVNGVPQFPEFRWGSTPASANGLAVSVNNTVSANSSTDRAIVGDFASMFKWGYAKQIPMEIIPYGDPDNTGKDLKGYNQVYIRCEAYLGWAIMDGNSFVRITEAGA